MQLGCANKPGVARRQLTFLLRRQKKSKQKKRRPDGLGPLRCAAGQPPVLRQKRGLARTRLRLRQSRALARFCLRSSAQPDGWKARQTFECRYRTPHPECRTREALPARESQQAVMFARERSARDHMRSPSIAQRGEGNTKGLPTFWRRHRVPRLVLEVNLQPLKGEVP